MAGNVESLGFSPPYHALNGTRAINATKLDIIRSMLCVGYPSRNAAIRHVGIWRARMLTALVTGYLDDTLATTQYFDNLEQSEKAGASFLLGEAFTHWYAESRMNVRILVHVRGLPGCVWNGTGAPFALKYAWNGHVGRYPEDYSPHFPRQLPPEGSRPDFIGFAGGERHVFESKGRLRKPSAETIDKALGQVSKLHSIRGVPPDTRCACFFMFRKSGVEGMVIDPPAAWEGLDLQFDELAAAEKAYAFFLESETRNLDDEVGKGFVGQRLDNGFYFAIDRRIVDILRDPPKDAEARQTRFAELLDILETEQPFLEGRREDGVVASGLNGTLLMDRSSD